MKLVKLVKRGLYILTSIALASSLSGCNGQEGSKGKLLKIAVCVSNQTPASIALKEVFKPIVDKLTNKKYDIQIYDSGVLGSEKVVYDYTRNGIIEMCVVGTPMWSETPVMAIPDFPFVFRDVEHARRCYQGELGDYISENIESQQPVKLMSWFPNGARAFSSNKKIENLNDFKGQKLRMPNNPIHVKLAESLGANVVIMDMGEVFTALEQGVCDGQDNPLSTLKSEGWYEVQKYIFDTCHIVASLELFAGEQFWNSIDDTDKEIFMLAAKETSDYAWDLYLEQLASDKQFMKDSGLTVTDLTDEERETMKQKIEPVYDYLDQKYEWAEDIRKMIDNIQ